MAIKRFRARLGELIAPNCARYFINFSQKKAGPIDRGTRDATRRDATRTHFPAEKLLISRRVTSH